PPAAPSASQPSQQFTDILLKALADNNLQGLDYFEYKQSLQATQNLGLDEAMRYRSAFAMGQTMGLTLPKLGETALYYINVLEREEQKFMDALKQQGEGKNRTMIDEIAAMEKAISDKTAQIEALHKEIADLQQKSTGMKQSVAEHAQKVEGMKNQFEGSYMHLRGQIEMDIQKIQQYLK
ncbi:MAG: hypothetical protein RI894_240, partial [Bacteroidota bacterium]